MKATIIGNINGIYVDSTNGYSYINPEYAENFSEVKMTGVNHVVVERNADNKMKIIQAGGYTSSRGMFVDLY